MVTLDLTDLEAEHLRRAVTAHYANTILAGVEPGKVAPTDVNREAAQSLYAKVESEFRAGR